jgi:PAS domain-containing protein
MSTLALLDILATAVTVGMNIGLLVLARKIYTVRPDIVPLRVVALAMLYLIVWIACDLIGWVFPDEVTRAFYGLHALLGATVAINLLYFLPKYAGLRKAEVNRRRAADLTLQSLPLTVLVVDDRLQIVYADGMGLRSIGLSPPSAVGKPLSYVISSPAVLMLYRRAFLETSRALVHSGEIGTPSGKKRFMTKVSPIRSDGKKLVMSIMVDVEEMQTLDRDFERQLTQLRSGDRHAAR